MSNFVCKDCKGTDVTQYPPGMFGEPRHRCNSCGKISSTEDFVVLTVFDRLTASPEALATKLVYVSLFNACWYSTLTGDVMYKSREEAEAATVEKLNEVEK